MKPTILICCDWYLPGFRGGGPVQSLDAMIQRLSASYRMVVVTRDRDVGDTTPYPHLTSDPQYVGEAQVVYLSPEQLTPRGIATVLRSIPYDVLYLNSVFSGWFSITPLWLRAFRILRPSPVVIAPRGELGAGALQLGRRWVKRAYLKLGAFGDAMWHAATSEEATDIQSAFPSAQVMTARDLANPHPPTPQLVTSDPTRVRAVFLSRITRKKNLRYAIECLRDVETPVTFDIYGPKEDVRYWKDCLAVSATLPARHTVNWLGPVPHENVSRTLAKYDVFLFPTLHESFGHVILESLLAGVPVLTSDQVPWDLAPAGAGWTLPLDKPVAFSRVLDSTNFATMRDAARSYGHAMMNDEGPVTDMANIFKRALS